MTRTAVATKLGFREQLRRPLLVMLLVIVPFFFITRAIAQTETIPRQLTLAGGAHVLTNMRDIHGAVMAAITIGFLAGLVGVFALQSVKGADRRLVLAGYRPFEILGPRLVILTTLTALVVVVSLGVTALSFTPRHWPQFIVGNVLIGLTYGMLGAIAGSAFGAMGATYVILFGAMLGLGIAGNPMFGSGAPPAWTVALPGGAAMRVITDASFAGSFAAWSALAVATIWLLAIGALLMVGLSRQVAVARG